MILRLSLDLPEDTEYVRTTRRLSRALLEDLQVVLDDSRDVEFIVNELCANVIRHARSSKERYTVVLEYYREKVVIQVQDHGDGFTPTAVPPEGTPRADFDNGERVGGFGLPLLKAISDNLEFAATEPQGMTVRAEKALHYQNAVAHARAAHMDQGGAAEVSVAAGDT